MSEQAAIGSEFEAVRLRPGADFTLGAALIQPALNRISINGAVAQVEPKVMQVLTLMAARPGQVIPREAFLETVWADTTGDDYLLNRAVSELRKIFCDDAQAPRYIETIRKTGYRLVAPIAPARVAAAVAAAASGGAASPSADRERADAPEQASAALQRFARPVIAASALVGIAGAAALIFNTEGPAPAEPAGLAPSYEVRPLTSFVGREYDPALSPDGSRVAFVWDGGGDRPFNVYVKAVGSETVLNLSNSETEVRYPVWSPDGREVLFARESPAGLAIMRVSALGGGARRVLTDADTAEVRGLAMAPDGERIAYAGREDANAPYRIILASLDTGEKTFVTNPPIGTLGDIEPLFSRDGGSLVFVRGVNEVTKDVYSTPLDGGAPQRVTHDNRKMNGLAWSPDGGRLLFGSNRSGMYRVWSIDPARGDDPQPLALGGESVQRLSTVAGSQDIAFEEWTHRAQIRRIDLAGEAGAAFGGHAASTRWDSHPAYSPDGSRVAFASNRAGPPGIWVSDRDGRNAVEIASLDGAFIERPSWSPDGRSIVFDGSPEGRTSVFLVSPEGGNPQRLSAGPGDSRNASWSRNGEWVYFESNVDGQWRIQARPAAGGAEADIAPGIYPRESIDGEWLLFTKPDSPGLWRRPRGDWRTGAGSGPEELLFDMLDPRDAGEWAAASGGVYFVRRPESGAPALAFFDYSDRSISDIASFPTPFEGLGIDLSPDETEIMFGLLTMHESDLRLATPASR